MAPKVGNMTAIYMRIAERAAPSRIAAVTRQLTRFRDSVSGLSARLPAYRSASVGRNPQLFFQTLRNAAGSVRLQASLAFVYLAPADGRTTVIAITGSVGKTTAKECLAAALAAQARL